MRFSRIILTIGISLIVLAGNTLVLSGQGDRKKSADAPAPGDTYLGQIPPGEKAELFAPEVLIHEPHDSPIISRDETWLIFLGMEGGAIFYKMTGGHPTLTTNPMGFEIPEVCNGMAVSPSENRVYIREWKNNQEYLYYIDRKGDKWTAPEYIELNSFDRTWQFSVAMNENLYFAADKIMVSVFDGAAHTEPVPLKLDDDSDMLGGSPYIAPDESYIIYSVDGDLHISYNLKNGRWTKPHDLGPNINSDQLDICPQISPNGKYLLFNSRRNPPDWAIYWADASFIEDLRPKNVK
jgi:hypothetical protein